MKILITAGGTAEKIDDVRRITNSATGALGAMIANAFKADGQMHEITYICTEDAVRPDMSGVIICGDVNSVKEAVLSACSETEYDVIVHSMAIGDYRVRAVSDSALITEKVIERLSGLACGDSSSPEEAVRDALLSPPEIKENKISSEKEDLIVVLEKAPKIISMLRGLAPNAMIVGFKLLSDVSEDELARVGHALLVKNDCDYVLANDLKTIKEGRHDGILIARDGTYENVYGKEEIAALIVERSLNQ